MQDWYIMRIESKKRGNMDIYNNTILQLFGKQLTWKEVKNLDKEQLIELTLKLESNINKEKSPFDIKKLTRAIQHSRSGAGGCAITQFECAFCGKEESWGNTAIPNICSGCAEEMAENIVLCQMDIFK